MSRLALVGVGLLCSLSLLGAGCLQRVQTVLPLDTSGDVSVATSSVPVLTWEQKTPGIERASVEFSTSTASTLVLYRFALANYSFSFKHASSAAVSEWATRLPGAVFVSNGVYFHDDQLPSGWFKTDNQVVGARSFDLDKSALLTLRPDVGIQATPSGQTTLKKSSTEAAQSYPLLIMNGLPAVKMDSGKTSRRTFVGIDWTHTYLYVGIVPYASISLYELGLALDRLPISWEHVLNLDGGPSSGIAFRGQGGQEGVELIDSYVTVPNVVVVTPRR